MSDHYPWSSLMHVFIQSIWKWIKRVANPSLANLQIHTTYDIDHFTDHGCNLSLLTLLAFHYSVNLHHRISDVKDEGSSPENWQEDGTMSEIYRSTLLANERIPWSRVLTSRVIVRRNCCLRLNNEGNFRPVSREKCCIGKTETFRRKVEASKETE